MTAAYWRENYDLSHILCRDWPTLGPKLRGKLWIYADAVIDYGDHTRSNAWSRLRYPQMVLPWAVERMLMPAPKGADVQSWRY